MGLRYTGNGFHIVGIPARDLTDEDIEKTGMTEKELINTGIYKKVTKKSTKAEEV